MMVKMGRGEFYFVIWMLITCTSMFAGMDEQGVSTLSIFLAVGLYAHYFHLKRKEDEKRQKEFKARTESRNHE